MRKCRNCEKSFKETKNWQVFCSAPCRDMFNSARNRDCFYCGAPGKHRDHVDPVSRTGKDRNFTTDEWVWSCIECNLVLTNNVFYTVEDRIAHLITNYQSKADTLAAWEEDEIVEMGRGLVDAIREQMYIRGGYETRVRYLKYRRSYMRLNHADKKPPIAEPEPKISSYECIRCGGTIPLSLRGGKPFCGAFCGWMYEKERK